MPSPSSLVVNSGRKSFSRTSPGTALSGIRDLDQAVVPVAPHLDDDDTAVPRERVHGVAQEVQEHLALRRGLP